MPVCSIPENFSGSLFCARCSKRPWGITSEQDSHSPARESWQSSQESKGTRGAGGTAQAGNGKVVSGGIWHDKREMAIGPNRKEGEETMMPL